MVAPVEIKVSATVDGSESVTKLTGDIGKLGTEAIDAGVAGGKAASGITEIGAAVPKTTAAVNSANTALSKTKAEADKAATGIKGVGDNAGVATQAMGELVASMAAGFGVQQFVQAAADMEKMAAGLLAVSGNAAAAKEQMDFVRAMAQRAGIDVTEAAAAFLSLSVATKGTAVEGQVTKDVFEAVTVSMAKAGKSSADTSLALQAIAQMAGKGVVSIEELRGQLGEALPGALQAAASGLGVTTADLIKLAESGKIAAEDIFPALTTGLTKLYGTAPKAQTLSQEITNIKNSFIEMSASIADAGALSALKTGAETAQTAITVLGETLITTGQTVGALAAAVTSLDFSGIPRAMEEIETASRERLLKAAANNEVLRDYLKLVGDQATKTGIFVQEMGIKTEEAGNKAAIAGQQAAGAASGFTALALAYTENSKGTQDLIDVTLKEIEAIKARGQAAIAQATLMKDDVAIRQATKSAAEAEAAAMETLARLRQSEVDILRGEHEQKTALLQQAGPISEQRQKELDDLQRLIDKKQLDADKSLAQAKASKVVAAQAAKSAEGFTVVEAALAKMGITSDKELKKAAADSLKLAEAVKAGGGSAAETAAAFANYATKAIAANKGVVPEVVKVIAAMNGLKIETDSTGKAVVSSMETVAQVAARTSQEVQDAYKQQVAAAQEFQAAQNKMATDAAAAKEAEAVASEQARQANLDNWREAAAAMLEQQQGFDAVRERVGYTGDAIEVYRQKYVELMQAKQDDVMFTSVFMGKQMEAAQIAKSAAEQYDNLTRAISDQEAANTSAAQGVEDLKLKLLEIEGTEQEVEAAKKARDLAKIERQIKLNELEAKRLELLGKTDEAKKYTDENAALREQIKLLEKIEQAEDRKAQKKKQDEKQDEKDSADRAATGAKTGSEREAENNKNAAKMAADRAADRAANNAKLEPPPPPPPPRQEPPPAPPAPARQEPARQEPARQEPAQQNGYQPDRGQVSRGQTDRGEVSRGQPDRGPVVKRYEIVIDGRTYTADSDADARALIDQLTKAKLSY